MAYNFLSLVNDVNRRLNEVELTSANFTNSIGFYSFAKDAINTAIREINTQSFEWPFNHDTQRDQLYAGDVRYLIPRDVKSVDMDSFRVVRDSDLGNPTVKLQLISYEEYLDKYIDYEYSDETSIRGIPQFVFRTPSLEYGVVPPPDKDYPIEYEYYRALVELTLPTDVPSVPEDFRGVIIDGAMAHVYAFRGDTDAAQISAQRFEAGLKSMRSLYINRYEYIRDTRVKY